ncbi:MAG: hypothetical protein H0V64_14285 [Geodermatophilaceae bacterium]|nr:hypothetical protein [Geodermatophilaceae bacterium]
MTPQELAGWDIDTLRRGSTQFLAVAETTRAWVTRADAVGQALAAPAAWDGPASEAAQSTLRAWLAVTARLNPALEALAAGVAEAVGWYAQAQDAAAAALRAAGTHGITVGADGVVSAPPGYTTRMEADQAAAAAERAAAAAAVQAQVEEAFRLAARGDALVASDVGVFTGLGIPGFTAGSDFVDLMAALHVTVTSAGRLPTVPPGADPQAVATWWSGLSLDEQFRLARERPDLIGGLDGVPAWARDTANRILLDDALRELLSRPFDSAPGAVLTSAAHNQDLELVLAVQAALIQAEASGQPAQLYLFDIDAGLAAISIGDLDTADNVAVIVPGTAVNVTGDMGIQVSRAQQLWSATQEADGSEDVAVLAWIGYDTPNYAQAPSPWNALTGAPLLAATVGGLTARPGNPPRTTVVAHSYGTVTTAAAGRQPGEFDADAVVLLGSPGTGGTAADFENPDDRVFVGEAEDDWIADTWAHGIDPSWEWWYGGTCIAADMPDEDDSDHYHYFDPDSEALHNMALIVQGRYRSVVGCDD